MNSKHLFIALYGINNIGKSTQAQMLGTRIAKSGLDIKVIKYPIYEIPSGQRINAYLRSGNPENMTPKEAQMLYVENRADHEKDLLSLLEKNIVLAEDYTGTGIAWGVGAGVDKNFLIDANEHLVREDLAILMDGHRFLSGKEANHKHENDNPLINRVREVHMELAEQYGWKIVNANRTPYEVHYDIWQIVSPFLNK